MGLTVSRDLFVCGFLELSDVTVLRVHTHLQEKNGSGDDDDDDEGEDSNHDSRENGKTLVLVTTTRSF